MGARTIAAATLLALAGCLEREETITIERDGTVIIEASFHTESEREFYEGDVLPTAGDVWLVDESVEIDEEGTRHFRLAAEGVFSPDVLLPESYALPGDPDEDLYLTFPTTVAIEPRADGIYYHFHRRYPPRDWARVEMLRELIIDEQAKALEGKSEQEITPADRQMLVAAYAEYEAAKMLAFARRAYLDITPDDPQDGWLAVHAAVSAFKDAVDKDRVARILRIEDEQERDDAIREELDAWEDRAFGMLQAALREHCGYAGRRMSEFVHAYQRQRRGWEITGELGDDAFQVTVVMPGEIVGSNADTTAPDRVTWRFSGRRFRDREHELLVTSRVDYD